MKKTTLAKYKDIAFPVFALKQKPYKVIYDLTKISCIMKPDGHLQLVDDKSLAGDYFARLVQLKTRLTFDYTCRNVQDLIYTGASWGIDSKAIPHDFSRLTACVVEKRQVSKVHGNLFWLRNISYPFEIPTQESIRLEDTIYATMVFVNGEWFLKEFSYDSKLERPYIYV